MHNFHLFLASSTLGVVLALQTPFLFLGYTQRTLIVVGTHQDWLKSKSRSRQRNLPFTVVLFPNPQHKTTRRITQMSLRSRDPDQENFEFKEFDIAAILSEAEDALKAAEDSLELDKSQGLPTISMESTLTTTSVSNKPQSTPPSSNITGSSIFSSPLPQLKTMDTATITDTISCTVGGILFGSVLGYIATFQFSEVFRVWDPEGAVLMPPLLTLPIFGGLTLGTVGVIGASQSNILGTVTRILLGAPILALVSAILFIVQILFASLQSAAQRQAEKIAKDIKELPQNVANSAQLAAKSSIESAVEEVTSMPRKVRDRIVQSSVQVANKVKSSVESAGEGLTSLPRKNKAKVVEPSTQPDETVKTFPREAKEIVAVSGIWSSNFLLALVVIPSLIGLGFLVLGGLFDGQVPPPSM
jgi:hypothetical protein